MELSTRLHVNSFLLWLTLMNHVCLGCKHPMSYIFMSPFSRALSVLLVCKALCTLQRTCTEGGQVSHRLRKRFGKKKKKKRTE